MIAYVKQIVFYMLFDSSVAHIKDCTISELSLLIVEIGLDKFYIKKNKALTFIPIKPYKNFKQTRCNSVKVSW